MNNRAIGIRIKEFREGRNLTQEQLAERVGISATHVSVIERGVKAPRLETLIGIANALNVNADSLLLDVLNTSRQIEAAELSELIEKLPPNEQKKILKAVRILVED